MDEELVDDIPADASVEKKGGLSRGCIVGIVLAVVLACGGVSTCVFGGIWVASWGMDLLADEVKGQLASNPVVLEHVGEIEDIEISFTGSGAESHEEMLVFELVGTKSDAVLTVRSVTVDGGEDVVWGRIRLPSGEEYDLFPDQGAKPR